MLKSKSHFYLAVLFCYFLIFSHAKVYSTTYEVGPGKTYSSILQVPTHNLQAGDSVKVFHRTNPYFEKFLLHGVGTSNNPIHFIGIPDSNGNKPVLDGQNALSSTAYNYFNENRQVVLIGQSGVFQTDHLVFDGFEIQGAHNNHAYTSDQGATSSYQANAAGVRVSWGKNITIRNCDIHSNGNGVQNGDGAHQNLIIEHSKIHNNGVCTWSNSYIHNFYLSSGSNSTVTIQYCHVGELLSNGQQVRSRASTTVIRYNWIEGGRNSSLDLMEDVDSFNVYVADAYVYGNVIIKPDTSQNARMIHFGGDQPNSARKGTLYFFNNTLIIKDARTWGTKRVFAISSDSSNVIADNNIIYKPSNSTYDLLSGSQNLTGSNNWISNNINGTAGFTSSLSGIEPGFRNPIAEDYVLKCSSPCYDLLSSYTFPSNHNLNSEYLIHLQKQNRAINGPLDLGAFETPLSPLVFLGNDTSIIVPATLTLNAGNGLASYLWSDGSIGSSLLVASPGFAIGPHSIHVSVTDTNSCSNSDTINVTIQAPLGRDEFSPNLKVYPNPSNGKFVIEGEGLKSLLIMDLRGQIIQKMNVNGSGLEVDLSRQAKGVYLLKLESNKSTIMRRLIIH